MLVKPLEAVPHTRWGMLMTSMIHRVERFLQTDARLLERLLYEIRFHGADSDRALMLVNSYQNPDGGLGNALEPDVRCVESQPLSTEFGLIALFDAGVKDRALARSICDFLQNVATDTGLVSTLLPSALGAAHAPHWTSTGTPGLNPTAGICGLLHWQGAAHPWLSTATSTCCDLLLHEPQTDAHALLSATRLAEHIPDKRMATRLYDRIAELLPSASFFVANAPATSYGLMPLDFAPTPTSRWRHLFTDDQITGHLSHLASAQEDDGGWPIAWETVSAAATAEWRGRGTLNAIISLVEYDDSTDFPDVLGLHEAT